MVTGRRGFEARLEVGFTHPIDTQRTALYCGVSIDQTCGVISKHGIHVDSKPVPPMLPCFTVT